MHKINEIYRDLHAKFLKAIDHMEYHATSGRKNKTESIRVGRSRKELDHQWLENQLKYLTHQDAIMLGLAARLLEEKSQNNTGKTRKKKRFGLFSWILGWGVYSNLRNIQAIKANVTCLQEQNVLQEKQITELAHYLNVTYNHVTTNQHAIKELHIKMATIEKTLLSTTGEIRYMKYVSLVLVDI